MRTAHFVVPESIDDPARPTGGNVYDRKVIQFLSDSGWHIHEHRISGQWPRPDEAAERVLGGALARIPDQSAVIIDGLFAGTAASVVVRAAARLRLVVLMHLPLGHQPPGHGLAGAHQQERSALTAASATIVTSEWTRRLLLHMYDNLDPRRVHVAAPGVDAAPRVAGTPLGGRLLCVAAVTWHKGLDLLLTALSTLTALSWQCTCAGVLDREPTFAAELQRRAASHGLTDRIIFTGPVVGSDLDRLYASADLLLLPSRGETYGMVLTEALARGVPVVAAAVGGVPDTIGHVRNGHRPGLLIPPNDSTALATAIRRWLEDGSLRAALRHDAALRRSTLPAWSATAHRLAGVIAEVAA